MQTWIHSKLKECGITQRELAKRIGICHEALNRKINGKSPFMYWEVVKICKELGIENPRDFFE